MTNSSRQSSIRWRHALIGMVLITAMGTVFGYGMTLLQSWNALCEFQRIGHIPGREMEAAACLDKARRCGATLLTLLDCISQFVDDDSIKEMQSAVSPDFVYVLNPPREAPNLNAGEVVSNQSAYEQELIAYRKAGDKSYREQIECLWTLQHWNEMK